MGIFNKPKLRGQGSKRDSMPDDLWTKCSDCGELIHSLDLKQNLLVCPKCDHHFLIGSRERINLIADEGSFEETDADLFSKNPLGFAKYEDKIAMLREKTDLNDAVVTGSLTIQGKRAVIAVMDFKFFAGSMGSVVGEKITRAVELATAEKRGIIIVSASSGARMQEGMLSLMQMAKTCGALARHSDAGLPYISLMTHPTTGGVTASFATIGDINLAEPKCMIGFAGPRVVKETTHQDLPPGFQTAEFMVEHGLVDDIVHRNKLRDKLGQLLGYMLP
ncbi:acetyl-CoA carboxylase carboxyltransferase subunit beta [Verrucomicrobiaceae bacterium R5-34]|uniref:Acetyl-coenzyme A carboxylase carboxyl transferase subunit beta n=1 Tax=Oceaniferula flava TaxID=2800421 RepID=A0AAE2V7E5_9BACT|nr:acetyl-CoA carboxylase, carboxyltransferase subunit beta [Oceaniferula flavus]MBK1829389.1 acetyl-CoA carboxylase carboxyltransferase subunit beta [Verrucomicrobiaceae bacterium R5-34]MBK1853617.1 acetyl-CoA carboxylase carboxyltransferase subunit beta [Oceaniferula flavus]MBM1134922.1 acetyl-CoA carboxylase carboxyltransferase subunit beta [Oceaniferula flavus]